MVGLTSELVGGQNSQGIAENSEHERRQRQRLCEPQIQPEAIHELKEGEVATRSPPTPGRPPLRPPTPHHCHGSR